MTRIDNILRRTSTALKDVEGIRAVVLGGSRARGNASADSDIDVGLYYDADSLDLDALDCAASFLDNDRRTGLIAPPGAWGDWVNGGGWLAVDGCHVDLILRDFARVARVVADCTAGKIKTYYQTGHPHAYVDAMYMGELAVCKIIWERDNAVSRLKEVAKVYPPKLREAMLGFFSFEAGFSLSHTEANARRDDVYYVAAHVVRSVSCLNQVLFALNGEYCLNEKKAVALIEGFPIKPSGYKKRIDDLFSLLGVKPQEACAILRELFEEVQRFSA